MRHMIMAKTTSWQVSPSGRGELQAQLRKGNLAASVAQRIRIVLRRHTKAAHRRCSTLQGKQVSPHVLRHTCAMVVLQATQDIRKVSLWLGHSNLTTTEVYVRTDPTEKLAAIEAVVPPSLRKGKFRPPDKLLALLKTKS